MNTSGTLKLPQLGIIKASGAQAAEFLNTQLSASTIKMKDTTAQLATYCSAQGRMLASFIVLQNTPEEMLLIASSDILEVTLERLNKFIMRSKVQLSIVTDLAVYGQTAPSITSSTPAPFSLKRQESTIFIELPTVQNIQRHLIITPTNLPLNQDALLSTTEWEWLNIHAGFLMVDAHTREQFVPQMLNYESLGAIDFNKGCYPGQEVVARSQFRGTVKRRLTILHAEQEIQSGDFVFSGEEKSNLEEVGNILVAAHAPEHGWSALAVLPIDAQKTPLAIGAGRTRANVIALPYILRDDF